MIRNEWCNEETNDVVRWGRGYQKNVLLAILILGKEWITKYLFVRVNDNVTGMITGNWFRVTRTGSKVWERNMNDIATDVGLT